MEFFTLDWYHNTLVSQMCFSLRKSFHAAKLNEKYFQSLYKSEKKKYVRNIKLIGKYSNTPFDLKKAEEDFEKNYEDNLEFVKTIPCEITDKIADMRVFALGVVEYDVFDDITKYCGQINRKCEKVKRDYEDHVDSFGNEIGWKKLDKLTKLKEAEISDFKLCGNDLVITSESNCFEMTLYNGVKQLPETFMHATLLAIELYKNDEGKKLKLSLLCESLDSEIFEETLYFDDFEIVETE